MKISKTVFIYFFSILSLIQGFSNSYKMRNRVMTPSSINYLNKGNDVTLSLNSNKNALNKLFMISRNDNMELIGEDAANFQLEEQSIESWCKFTAAVSAVLGSLFYIWVWDNGLQWGNEFKEIFENLAGGDSTTTIVYMLGFFAIVHSGLASLRPIAEDIIGARAWRVIFAYASLPVALSCIVYFINHRYDGVQLWDLRSNPLTHQIAWITSFVSFLFLYPSTFNLLEVAAIDKPQLHLWETGVIRITRHPQMVGQVMWCAAHTAIIGTSFTLATSAMLCLHHVFAVWNGDRRLKDKWGDKAKLIKERTSVIPFAAIVTGKQKLPENYLQELFRLPYIVIILATSGAYLAHPYMQAYSALLKW